MSGQIQESINFRHGDPSWTISNSYDLVARPNFSFLQHAKVEPWPVMCNEQGWHSRFIHANDDAEAGYAGLCHFKDRITNAVPITDTNLVIGKSFNGEILSELAETKSIALKDAFPVSVRIHLVDKYGSLLTTVTGKIRLRVTIDIELADHPPLLYRKLPDRCSHSPAVPGHFARKTDIQREQSGH
jgi:hypothetical protein